jgi:hypothetical protein
MDPGTAALVLSSAVSAIGQLQAGANAQKAANFNAQVAFNNAHAARLAALEDSKRQKRLGAKRQGARRAIDPDKLDLLEDNAIEEELAFQSIIHAGEVQAVGFGNTARLEIARGKAARSAATFGAFSSVLMGGAEAYGGDSSLFSSGGGAGISAGSKYTPLNLTSSQRRSPF